MKAFVSSACIGCGLCESVCADVFHLTDSGQAEAIAGEVPPESETDARDARDGCPVDAIDLK
ncbi:MAG: ferredoxin [Butyricicoccus sp.]